MKSNTPDPFEVVHDSKQLNNEDYDFVPDRSRSTGAVVVHHAVTIILIITCFALGTWGYLTFKSTSFFVPVKRGTQKSLQPFMVKAQSDRLRHAIGIYYKMNNAYPSSLDDLVSSQILAPSDPYYPPHSEFIYEKLATSYSLTLQTTEDAPVEDAPVEEVKEKTLKKKTKKRVKKKGSNVKEKKK